MNLTSSRTSSTLVSTSASLRGGISSVRRFCLALSLASFLALGSASRASDDTATLLQILSTLQSMQGALAPGPQWVALASADFTGVPLWVVLRPYLEQIASASTNDPPDWDAIYYSLDEIEFYLTSYLPSLDSDLAGIEGHVEQLYRPVYSTAEEIDGSSYTVGTHDAITYGAVLDLHNFLQDELFTMQSSVVNAIDGATTSTNLPPNTPSPQSYSNEIDSAEYSAREVESDAEHSIFVSSTNNLPLWEYTRDVPGDLSPITSTRIDFSGASGLVTSDSGIPLLGSAIVAAPSLGGITLPSTVIEVTNNPGWNTYVRPWKNRISSLMVAFWTLITAFCVCYVVRREWLYYMGVSSSQSEAANADASSAPVSDNFFG